MSSLTDLDKRVTDLAAAKVGLWKNQQNLDTALKSLVGAQRSLDHQVAVLTRFTVVNINKMRALAGLDYVTEDELSNFFEEWNLFYQRGDANEHMSHWVLGKPLEDLPDPPAKDEEETTPPAPEDAEEGPTVFGGDYAGDHGNEDAQQEGPEDEGSGPSDAVPSLPDEDGALDQGESGGAALSKVSA